MSYSVSNLFKSLAVNQKVPEGQLDNPDIPSFSQAGGVDVQFIRDQAYNALKLSSAPRNGDGYLLPRSTFSDNPKHEAFLLEGAIDPNVIRQRVNPISEAAPVASENSLYGVDSTMSTESNSVDLITKARSGFYSYKNRFNTIDPIPNKSIESMVGGITGVPVLSGPPPTASATDTPQSIDVLAGVKKGSGRPTDGSI